MENPPSNNPEQPTSVVGRLTKRLTQFTKQQKPAAQAAIANALAAVNGWLIRLQKK
ncbi:MAG: hypothetical protein JO320_18865 [Alphaproteobacteria bacterium]|nr:hypothetical protein [Alphaproteobacteria bacterium]